MNDVLHAMDDGGPENLVSDRRSGMRGVLVIDNTARRPPEGIGHQDAAWRMAETRVRAAMAVRGQIRPEEGNL